MTTTEVNIAPGITNIYGPSGSMKSSMALTWPKPMAIWDFDLGIHRAWGVKQRDQKWLYQGEADLIDVKRPPLPKRSFTQRYAELIGFSEFWNDFITGLTVACEDDSIQTIVIDTGTVEWNICCDAYLQELQQENKAHNQGLRKQLQQIEYGEPNKRERQVLEQIKSYQKHCVLIHHETQEYEVYKIAGVVQKDEMGRPVSNPTGNMVPDGFRHLKPQLDWELYVHETEKGSNHIRATIQKSSLGIDLIGVDMGGDGRNPTYQDFMQILIAMDRL
jgi:hypothetical protein